MKCKRCKMFIQKINIGDYRNPILIDNCILGYVNDVFCGYCASTCFFINGEMLSMEEIKK